MPPFHNTSRRRGSQESRWCTSFDTEYRYIHESRSLWKVGSRLGRSAGSLVRHCMSGHALTRTGQRADIKGGRYRNLGGKYRNLGMYHCVLTAIALKRNSDSVLMGARRRALTRSWASCPSSCPVHCKLQMFSCSCHSSLSCQTCQSFSTTSSTEFSGRDSAMEGR